MRKIIASLDIGTNSIKLIVGEFLKNTLHILSVSETPTKGIKKGLVANREELIPVLKENFHKAEEMLGIPISEVILTVPSYEVNIIISEGSTTITNPDRIITNQDLIRSMQASSYNKITDDQELLSIIPIAYKINDDEIVKNPLNIIADKLTIKAVLVTSPKEYITPLINVVEAIGIKVIDVIPTAISDIYLLKSSNLGNVGALINIGEETTCVSIYNKGVLMRADVIELGGANIDKDIAYIYKTTKKDAKRLKEKMGLATSIMAKAEEKETLTDRLGNQITINQKELSEVIESRLEELLALAKKLMNNLTKRNIEYIFITGGTTELKDFNILCDKVFTKTHILGKINYIGVRNNKYNSALGALLYFNSRLKMKGKEYCCFSLDDLETISGNAKKVNINEKSILGKLFGYFFDN